MPQDRPKARPAAGWLAAAFLLPLAPQAALAEDEGEDLGLIGAEAPGDEDEDAGGFRLSYGVAITSEYIDDGESQSNGNPALQGYVEGSFGPFFAGVWSSTVDFEDSDDNLEFDLYAGVRHGFGDLEVALSYVRYLYDQTGDCCGELQLAAEYELDGGLGAEVELSWDPQEDATWTELGLSYGFAEKWTLSSSIGTDFGTESEADEEEGAGGGRDTVAWEIGLARQITDTAALSLVYHDSNKNPDGLVLTLAFDF